MLKILSKLIKLEAGQTLKDISISSVDPALINTALQNYEKATGIAAADTISIFTSLRSHLKTLKDFIDNFSKYSAVSRVSKEKQTIIHRISEKCTIPEMKTALNHMEQMFSSSPYEQFLLAFQNSADKIFWDYLEKSSQQHTSRLESFRWLRMSAFYCLTVYLLQEISLKLICKYTLSQSLINY